MAECPRCGAITTQVLELTWRVRMVTCTECLMSMHLDRDVLAVLRKQAADAMATVDRLP
jgi:transposase